MTNYTDYNFYTETYKGNMPESSFNRLITRASNVVRKSIMSKNITGYENDIQNATCAVVDILYKIEELENKKNIIISDKKIKSENVGPYSRTFESTSLSDIDKEISNQEMKIYEEIENYLFFTGLLNRGVHNV